MGLPKYFARNPAPKHPRDPRTNRYINLRLTSPATIYKWEFEQGRQKMEVAVEGQLVFDDANLAIDAALAGMGIAFVLENHATAMLESGALVRVLS